MTLHLDRTEVEANAGVLAYIPQPNVEETMTWVNRVFRSSEPNTLNEKRTNITPYPAITVNYQYLYRATSLISSVWFETILTLYFLFRFITR